MKEFFERRIIDKAISHCRTKLPEEACGFIVDDDFIPLENVSDNKIEHFKIDPKEYIIYNEKIRAVVHSHDNAPFVSKDDMIHQEASEIPWGIINFRNGHIDQIVFWGDQLPVQDLLGRPFFYGAYDCYALVRDYHRLKGKPLPIYPREYGWWEKPGKGMLVENVETVGSFDQIQRYQLREGDMIFMNILSDTVNHSGIYIEDGKILHHLLNRLSVVDPIYPWEANIHSYYRYMREPINA